MVKVWRCTKEQARENFLPKNLCDENTGLFPVPKTKYEQLQHLATAFEVDLKPMGTNLDHIRVKGNYNVNYWLGTGTAHIDGAPNSYKHVHPYGAIKLALNRTL